VSVNTRVIWFLHTGRGKAAVLNFSKILIIFESKTVISYRVAILPRPVCRSQFFFDLGFKHKDYRFQ